MWRQVAEKSREVKSECGWFTSALQASRRSLDTGFSVHPTHV